MLIYADVSNSLNAVAVVPFKADPTMIASTFVKPKINWRTVNAHFKPLSQHCGLQNGMTYDFYLKTEELDDWYVNVCICIVRVYA